ncbi:hypothetical protein Golomagni_00878 [Golovinomyces magnicellulatus]|nr:hypothetical protein Golomagni_00878 [Golovinomyces magnicellulatus]
MLSPRVILRVALVAFFSLPLIGETYGAVIREDTTMLTARTTNLEPRGTKTKIAVLSLGAYAVRKKIKKNRKMKKLKKDVKKLKKAQGID